MKLKPPPPPPLPKPPNDAFADPFPIDGAPLMGGKLCEGAAPKLPVDDDVKLEEAPGVRPRTPLRGRAAAILFATTKVSERVRQIMRASNTSA